MRIFFAFIVALLFTSNALAMSEQEKIAGLLEAMRMEPGLVFIRNGSEKSGPEAAQHLQSKVNSRQPKTAQDFIIRVASISETSGKPYMVRLADGKQMESVEWLQAKLKEIDPTGEPAWRTLRTAMPASQWRYFVTSESMKASANAVKLVKFDPLAVMTTDGPHRASASIPLEDLVTQWGGEVRATLAYVSERRSESHEVTLSRPQVDGETLAFTLKAPVTLPASAHAISLYIDGSSLKQF